LDGIKIDRSDEDENACDSIRVNREFDSNEIDESDLQFEIHRTVSMASRLTPWTVLR
jgi:hypothetical protein